MPDHSTLSRRAETLEVPRPKAGSAPVHLLVDSTGLKLCGPGEWLVEKHGTRRRRAWKRAASRDGRRHRPDCSLGADRQAMPMKAPKSALCSTGIYDVSPGAIASPPAARSAGTRLWRGRRGRLYLRGCQRVTALQTVSMRSQTDGRQATKVAIAAGVLNRMLELGRPEYVRIA